MTSQKRKTAPYSYSCSNKENIFAVFHAVCLISYSWALYIELFHFALHYNYFAFKFATVWFNLYCVVYHLCASLKLVLVRRNSSTSPPDKVHKAVVAGLTSVEDKMFACIIFPQAPIICMTFWTFFWLDPISAVPLHVQRDKYWLYVTHLQHSFIVLTMLVDLIAKDHNYSARRSHDIRLMLIFTLSYNILLTIRGNMYNDWTYSFLQFREGIEIFALFAWGNFLLASNYCVGHFLNTKKRFWKKQFCNFFYDNILLRQKLN